MDPRLELTAFTPNYSPVIAWLAVPLASLPFVAAMVAFSALSRVPLWRLNLALTSVTTRIKSDVVDHVWSPRRFRRCHHASLRADQRAVVVRADGGHRGGGAGPAVACGHSLGLLVYKPNLLLGSGPVLLVAGQWRVVGGLVLGAGLELAANLAIAGPDVMRQYVTALLALAAHPELVQFYPAESHSLRGLVQLLLPWPPLVTASTAMALPLAAWLGARVWRTHADFRPRWAALVIASLSPARMC